MTGETVGFWFLSALLIASALAVVLTKNLFHSVLWLALALTGTAGIFLLLNAEFLAAVQLLLYAGGIITIVVFAIVVTERLVGERLTQTNMRIGGAALVSVVFLGFIVAVLGKHAFPTSRPEMPGDLTRLIGETVLTRYALPFELLAVLMLAGMLGAIY